MQNEQKPTILVVEDEPTLIDTLEYNLTRQGYAVSIASDGFKALELARSLRPDLIVLDVMLPGLDGFEICRILRREMNVPILMLTARDDEIDKVVGLEMGADDYLTKPFSMRELMARVKAHLRRVRMIREEMEGEETTAGDRPLTTAAISFGSLRIDSDRHEVVVGDEILHLKPKEFELLHFLARNRGMALSRDLILERVWDWDFDGGSRTVDVHVRWLRQKIEADSSNPTRIVTVRGGGYRFEG